MIARALSVALGCAVVAAVGLGAYALGHSAAPDKGAASSARKLAAKEAFAESFAAAHETGLERGARQGLRAGRTAGRTSGAAHGSTAGTEEINRRAGLATAVSEEAAADVAAAEAAEAESLYYETHPWAAPYPSTSPPPDGSTGVAPGCYPVEGVPCD